VVDEKKKEEKKRVLFVSEDHGHIGVHGLDWVERKSTFRPINRDEGKEVCLC